MIDRTGVIDILRYPLQLRRMADGGDPRPRESGLRTFLKSAPKSG